MEAAAPRDRRSARKRILAGIALLVVAALAVWLLMRGCEKAPDPVSRGFDYFHAKAEELGRDPDKVKAFVASDIKTLGYTGNAKGPLATLWNGAGTEEEKAQLEEVLLACCDPAAGSFDAWSKSPGFRDGEQLLLRLQTTAPNLTNRIARAAQQTGRYVGNVHSVEVMEGPKLRITLRYYGGEDVFEQSVEGTETCELHFQFQRDGKDTRAVVRELWNKDNRSGPTFPIVGDRHDFIVLPSRVSKFVREKEELRLKEAKRENNADAKAYLALLDYCVMSDKILAGLEKENSVTAQFDLPRVLILSKFNLPEFVGGPATALDLRQNYTSFEGDKVAAYSSVQTRSFAEAGLETKWLAKYTKSACTSAHDVITSLREDYPDEPGRRLQAVLDALTAAANEPSGVQLTFSAHNPSSKDAAQPEVTLTKLADGKWSIKSGPLNAALIANLEKNPDMPRLPLKDGHLDGATDSLERLALAVEVGLMAADTKPQTDPRYVLQTRLGGAPPSLVAVGASFTFAWGEGETRVDQNITVWSCTGALNLETHVQSGVRPVRGERTIPASAIENATLHNPWYAQGSDVQSDATSFVVSRKVFAALKAGKSSEFALAGRYATLEDAADGKPRPITWRGRIEPLGAATVKTRINNREEEAKVLRCKAGEREIAILDDPNWPVGMADHLLEVHTAIRCRLVDTKGTPLGGADLTIDAVKVTAAFDGSFRLPPRKPGGYVKLKATITRGDDPLGDAEVDLTAPGLSEIVVTIARPLKELVFIHPSERKKLDTLDVSAQVKRHANAALDRGCCVTIPNRMLHVGDDEQIAFYSFDPATGENIGVMEWGINGSTGAVKNAWKDAAKKVGKEAWDNKKDIAEGGLPPIHMLRGALLAWWGFAAYRLEGSSTMEAILRLINDMDYWEANSNIFNQAEKAIGGRAGAKVREKLAGAIGGNMDGGAAAVAFKCGYLGALGFLAKFMAARGNDD